MLRMILDSAMAWSTTVWQSGHRKSATRAAMRAMGRSQWLAVRMSRSLVSASALENTLMFAPIQTSYITCTEAELESGLVRCAGIMMMAHRASVRKV